MITNDIQLLETSLNVHADNTSSFMKKGVINMFSINKFIDNFISKGKEIDKVSEDNFNYEIKRLKKDQEDLMKYIIDDTENTINIFNNKQ